MDEQGIKYDYKITGDLEEAYSLSLSANKRGYDIIVAVGGDGTINRVLNGFYDGQGKRISGAKLGVVYTGTSPDFCRSYHIPLTMEESVRLISQNESCRVQIGQIRFAMTFDKKLDGEPLKESNDVVTRYFGCCANFGVGPLLSRNANKGIRQIFGDRLGTFLALLGILVSYRPSDFIISRNGKPEALGKVFNFSVGKTFYIASGIKVSHNLTEGDSGFYNLSVKNVRLKNLPGVLQKIYSGKKFINDGVVSLTYCKSMEVYGNNLHPEVEFDGDPAGFLPCRIEMAKDRLDLICVPL